MLVHGHVLILEADPDRAGRQLLGHRREQVLGGPGALE